MQYSIVHEIPGRVRIKLSGPVLDSQLDAFIKVLDACPEVKRIQVYGKIGQTALEYPASAEARNSVLTYLDNLTPADFKNAQTGYTVALAPRTHALMLQLARIVGAYVARRMFFPMPLRTLFALNAFRPFLKGAWQALRHKKLTVPVLDATAIGMSFVKRDPKTASQTMFLLHVGEALEDYTRAASENELIHSLLDVPDTVQKVEGDTEIRVPASSLTPGDFVAIRTGMAVCVDGVVVEGTAMVNQATLTGEPLAVERTVGDDVFAGTVVEEGNILVKVRETTQSTKLRSIVSLVEQAESLKSNAQTRMERAADRIVPWNFLLAGIIALVTRDITKVSASLMVDYSCALKLSGSIAVMSAMSNAAKQDIMVKGAKYFEKFAQADTIVFDKTGTLTHASPNVAEIITFGEHEEKEMLRLAACLEEHYPHSIANAVVSEAKRRNLNHEERHSKVEYVVAHGISSKVDGEKVIIGSYHFVFQDEQCAIPQQEMEKFNSLPEESLKFWNNLLHKNCIVSLFLAAALFFLPKNPRKLKL